MYLETIDEKAFRSFLSNPAISVLDGNVLDKYNGSNFYRFVRVPLSDGEHSVEALFGQMCSNYPTSIHASGDVRLAEPDTSYTTLSKLQMAPILSYTVK